MKPRPPRLPRRLPRRTLPGCQPAHHPAARLGAGAAVVAVPGHLLAAATIAAVIANATAWVTGILGGIATLFLVVGGARYLMAGGDPSEVEKAKTALKSAAKGYALALLAPVIVTVLKSVVGG
jgi:hypothetical protein